MDSWRDRWISTLSKFETATRECLLSPASEQHRKDSLEAVILDIWGLKDWLRNDPASGLSTDDLNAFTARENPASFHVRACADLATGFKHRDVTSKHRDDTKMTRSDAPVGADGFPIHFSATRDYGDGNVDHWEDVWELARRAINQWGDFLAETALLLDFPGLDRAGQQPR